MRVWTFKKTSTTIIVATPANHTNNHNNNNIISITTTTTSTTTIKTLDDVVREEVKLWRKTATNIFVCLMVEPPTGYYAAVSIPCTITQSSWTGS